MSTIHEGFFLIRGMNCEDITVAPLCDFQGLSRSLGCDQEVDTVFFLEQRFQVVEEAGIGETCGGSEDKFLPVMRRERRTLCCRGYLSSTLSRVRCRAS